MIKERPLLSQGDMVRATLEDRKTHTRRTRGLDKVNADRSALFVGMRYLKDASLAAIFENGNGELGSVKSPYGRPGDLLWVRETWGKVNGMDPGWGAAYASYRADEKTAHCDTGIIAGHVGFNSYCSGFVQPDRWRPSIHMPRWASRITLEVESVRVERLQDISEADSKAEGCGLAPALKDCKGVEACGQTFRAGYAALWESINGPGSWNTNPWVWVVIFKRIKP